MDLFDVISNDIKEAMKAKDKVKLETLRNVKKMCIRDSTSLIQPGGALIVRKGIELQPALPVSYTHLVVGAGGNRDKGKRPLMAQEAVKQSDKVIITSDNPRFEEPQEIINDMLAGLTKEDMRKVISIADRKEAIRTACMLSLIHIY